MSDVHPSPTAGSGRFKPRNTTYAPGDNIQELLECAQCGLPFRTGKDTEGDSQESPGISFSSGSYTQLNLTLVSDRASISVKGLDNSSSFSDPIFVAEDKLGVRYSPLISAAVLFSSPFPSQNTITVRALKYGPNSPVIGTLIKIVTPLTGLLQVSNNSAPATVGTLVEPTVTVGCRLCGTLNPRAIGRNKDFDYAFKDLSNR